MTAMREAEEARMAGKPGKKAIKFDNNFQANKNRNQDEPVEARSLDSALDLLSVGVKEAEKHPERRAKAAYKAFEEAMLPQIKEDYPGLKLSQYKQKLSELWRRSPDNPLNQESLAYNAKKHSRTDILLEGCARHGYLFGYLEGEAGYKIYFPTMRVVQHVMHAFLKEDIVYGDPYSDGYDTLLSEWLSKQSDSCSDDDNEKESIHMEDEEDESIISQEESMHSQDEVMLSGNELEDESEDESIPK
ncbi:unnamed protein product [Peronospora belbahrii]|uniref:Coiled-coil domain-containing protein n=1 Tax=Peronospora belbahrii TaxID=622444 RepID=A0AAU9LKI7_9STRA|nr:unnamed protein product [Peronospora belbahrii]